MILCSERVGFLVKKVDLCTQDRRLCHPVSSIFLYNLHKVLSFLLSVFLCYPKENILQINARLGSYVFPRIISCVVFSPYTLIYGFDGFLYSYCLVSIRVVKHDPDWFEAVTSNNLYSCMLFCDMIPICCCIAPLDFNCILTYDTIYLKLPWSSAKCVHYLNTFHLRVSFPEAKECRLF